MSTQNQATDTSQPQILPSFVAGKWWRSEDPQKIADVRNATTGELVARVSTDGIDTAGALDHGRTVGQAALGQLRIHDRALILKQLAQYLGEHKEELYEISYATGATAKDHLIDIDGGIGTLFAYASRGRRELPAGRFVVEGEVERLSRNGSFAGLHILSPLQGVAVHVNAFNFPCWGMLEKLAPAILAGMPVIAKPATATAYVAHAVAEAIVASGLLPLGAFQFVAGGTGDLSRAFARLSKPGYYTTTITKPAHFAPYLIEQLTLLVREFFDLRPYGLIQMLDLLHPIYKETAAYGHFGREHFPWEKTDKAAQLRDAAGL